MEAPPPPNSYSGKANFAASLPEKERVAALKFSVYRARLCSLVALSAKQDLLVQLVSKSHRGV